MDVIRWNEPRFGKEELEEVSQVLKESYVNEGPKTKELEDIFKNFLGIKHVIFTANCTASLFLAIKAESIKREIDNFEVILPDYTMFATASAVNWAGGKPIFVDINKEDLTIDVSKIEEKINKKTIAIIPVHILGRSAEIEKLKELAKKYNLSIIEDSAGALGSRLDKDYLGTIGDLGCFSLQSNKIVTSGQGGVIVTNDDKLNEIIRRLRDFGRFDKKEFLHNEIGYNLKFNDLSAALALAQMKKIESNKKFLLNQFNQYKKELSSISKIRFFDYSSGEIPLWVDVEVKSRDLLRDFLKENNVFCRDAWPALHRNPPYFERGSDQDFPNSSFASDNVIWLPNGPGINSSQISFVCEKIKEFYSPK